MGPAWAQPSALSLLLTWVGREGTLAGCCLEWNSSHPAKRKQDPKTDVAARHCRNVTGFILKQGCVTTWRSCKKQGILQKEDFPESVIQPNPNH